MHDSIPGLKLQHTFVAMLFALAAGHAALVATHVLSLWRDTTTLAPLMPALSHVALSLAVVSMSWVEWSRAVDGQTTRDPLVTIFQSRFFLLLLDVALVVLYFALAREVDVLSLTIDTSTVLEVRTQISPPDARGAVYWSCWILSGYLFYDFITDVLMKAHNDTIQGRYAVTPARSIKKWVRDRIADTFIGCYASLIALGFVAIVIRRSVPTQQTTSSVVWTNCALLGVFVIFRVLKLGEHDLARVVPGGDQGYFKPRRCGIFSAVLWSLLLVVSLVGYFIWGR